MNIGLIGVGKMGSIIAQRLVRAGHEVVGYDSDPSAVAAVDGMRPAVDLEGLLSGLQLPRTVWVMLPAGEATQVMLRRIFSLLDEGDVVIDGGNSLYRDSVERAREYSAAGLHFVDVGVSGGVWGLEDGYGVLVGGDVEPVERVWAALEAVASDHGAAHVGPAGSGHFAKMVHNGVEYGLMQAYAEGYELLQASELTVDVAAAMRVWGRACSIRSFLLDHMVTALEEDPGFRSVRGWVDDSGMGRWTVLDSVRLAVPAPVITAALQARFRSRQVHSPAMSALAATRQEIGGHTVKAAVPDTDGKLDGSPPRSLA